MNDVMQCPGCLRSVDITRPTGVDVSIIRATEDRRAVIIIKIGKTQIHRCLQCTDGVWR